jgi:hypothetical protein
MSSTSCLRLFPRLPVTSIFSSITCFLLLLIAFCSQLWHFYVVFKLLNSTTFFKEFAWCLYVMMLSRVLTGRSVLNNKFWHIKRGIRDSAVGWGTALQLGRSRVRLEFFIDIILPAAQWPWDWLGLWQKWVLGIFPGVKGGQCLGLTTLPPSCADCLEIWEPHPPGTLRACPGLWWDCFTFTLIVCFSQIIFSVVDICELSDHQIYKYVMLYSNAKISLTFVLDFTESF